MSENQRQEKLPRILSVDDDNSIHLTLKIILGKDYQFTFLKSASEAMKILQTETFDLALLDVSMPEVDGLQLLKFVRAQAPAMPVIMLTGNTDIQSAVTAIRQGASDYVVKSAELEQELAFKVERTLKLSARIRSSEITEKKLQTELSKYRIIGSSLSTLTLLSQIRRLTGITANVLISGESGTGKELVARTLNLQEPASVSRPLITVNCAAIPENLAESELFGHEKGAFTGALQRSIGKFQAANNGDLFFDEIGEMPLSLQAKLLRAIQESQVTPVGSNQPINVNVRIIAATNRDLHEEVKRGRFREDLYYRLAVVTLEMPPLRNRKDDIPAICAKFLTDFGGPKLNITNVAMSKLLDHSWPGNIRALRNCLERAWIQVISRDGHQIDEKDIHFDSVTRPDEQTLEIPGNLLPNSFSEVAPGGLEAFLDWSEKLYISRVLSIPYIQKKQLAEKLGFSRPRLYRKLKQFNLMPSDQGVSI